MTRIVALACAAVVAATTIGSASGPIGVYGIVEQVIFEPDERNPERVRIAGAFAYVEGFTPILSSAKRGYLYFRIPQTGESAQTVRREWADLKAMAGTGQAVAFGRWGWSSATRAAQSELRVRPASEAPSAPADYWTDSGLVKLSATGGNAEIVRQLKAALAR
jgi:hypothetical protein